MKRIEKDEYLRESLILLVHLCGVAAVRDALKNIEATGGSSRQTSPAEESGHRAAEAESEQRKEAGREIAPPRTALPRAVSLLAEADPSKYALLKIFFEDIESGRVLPEAEDIRRFVEHVGLKQLPGKSRRDLVARLAHVLASLPSENLENLLPKAKDISAKIRREGYSVLTDKLLENVKVAS